MTEVFEFGIGTRRRPIDDCMIGDVVDKLYKLTHKLSAAKSPEHLSLGLAAYQPPYLLLGP